MAAYESVLSELGYQEWTEYADFVQGYANDGKTGDGSMSHNGEFKVEGAWRKGDVSVHLERNTAPEAGDDEDMRSITTHPPVFVVSKGDKRVVTVMARDSEALKAVLSDLG